MLLTWIAELGAEEFLVEPSDPLAEARHNTWSLSAGPVAVTTGEVVAAFDAVAVVLAGRLTGVTLYAWHDEQVGALRVSISSLGPDALPFGAMYRTTGDLAPIVEVFLSDPHPGFIPWEELEDGKAEEPEPPPFPVWVRVLP
ncbi:hypothetical protein VA596_00985 [Amycolatopsis sp., V23-08]|uniref:Uncharacterized protein n=1 Tax=Amycolatopsis heterodermiae TaxID=3110235 RepID=A0ABU5QWV9_9PSEU|nr:hypothetical protein [Amycolatopsis sp., V23-08]MEA5358094.1 hypothetical protein [Amycolatopsis sp., V23-08]